MTPRQRSVPTTARETNCCPRVHMNHARTSTISHANKWMQTTCRCRSQLAPSAAACSRGMDLATRARMSSWLCPAALAGAERSDAMADDDDDDDAAAAADDDFKASSVFLTLDASILSAEDGGGTSATCTKVLQFHSARRRTHDLPLAPKLVDVAAGKIALNLQNSWRIVKGFGVQGRVRTCRLCSPTAPPPLPSSTPAKHGKPHA
jgi:hypothetical protein